MPAAVWKGQFIFVARQSEIVALCHKTTEVWKESSKSFHTSCLIANRDFTLTLNWGGVSIINSVSVDRTCVFRL
jgi:hypothetical protein